MGARTSPEMLRAIELIKQGKTRYEAAKITGVRITSITKSRQYREWEAGQKNKGEQK